MYLLPVRPTILPAISCRTRMWSLTSEVWCWFPLFSLSFPLNFGIGAWMPTKVQVLKLNTIKALSQDRLFLIEMKISWHLFLECYTVSVIADLAHTLRKSLQTTSASICNLKTVFWADFVSSIYNLKAVLLATCG